MLEIFIWSLFGLNFWLLIIYIIFPEKRSCIKELVGIKEKKIK